MTDVSTPPSLSSIRASMAAVPFTTVPNNFAGCRPVQAPPGISPRAWFTSDGTQVDMTAQPMSAFAGLHWGDTATGGGPGDGGGGGGDGAGGDGGDGGGG